LEANLRERTAATLSKNRLVEDFRRQKEEAKLKNWKLLQEFEKMQKLEAKHELEQMKKENQTLVQELARMKRAVT